MGTDQMSVLIVDDEESMRHILRLVLEKEGYHVVDAPDGEKALKVLASTPTDFVLCDIKMPKMSGEAFLKEVIKRKIPSIIIMMSAYGAVDTAITCMKNGAYDYISKPFKPDEVILTLRKAEERLQLAQENAALKLKLQRQEDQKKLVYKSLSMERIIAMVEQVASAGTSVLITGETGTGKELVARALHEKGVRKAKPFVAINCSAISPSLLESELFGHVRGAFTGADRDHSGLFGAAQGGTLFLDEIGELPLELQPKILRALQDGEVRKVGESKARKVDVRIVAATVQDIKKLIAANRFREDLYYRLAVIEIHIPPLRERKDDISVLMEYFLEKIADREGRVKPSVGQKVFDALINYPWPGNVRELVNVMEKAMIFCRGSEIGLECIGLNPVDPQMPQDGTCSLKVAFAALERQYILRALQKTGGNRTRAAQVLEISLRSLLYKIKEYGMG